MYYVSALLFAMAIYFTIIGYWHKNDSLKILGKILFIATFGIAIVIFLALSAKPI